MRPVGVVVSFVLGQHAGKLPLTENQHAIQAFAADRPDPAFGVGARLRGARGGLRSTTIPASANAASKFAVNFVSRSRIKNRKPSARSARPIMQLRACWVTHSPVGCRDAPKQTGRV